jgi:peptidoglycan-N-acetylglucosamine deacetylase
MKKILYVVLILSGVFLTVFGLYTMSNSRTFQFFGEIVHRVDTDQKVVALTFDDGPTMYTNDVLGILAEKDVEATFYVTGSDLEDYPNVGKSIVEQGHELGNHSYSHERFLLKNQEFIDKEIQTTNTLIREAGYVDEITFRPPYGKKLFGLPWYLMRHNIKTVTWDVEPDTFGLESEFIVNYTNQHVKNGSIILLHPFCESCVGQRAAIPEIIDSLREKGFEFVTVHELLHLRQD